LREFFNYPNGNIGGLEKLKVTTLQSMCMVW
jgi:hypothetical protein